MARMKYHYGLKVRIYQTTGKRNYPRSIVMLVKFIL